jgi:hypothetical protein
VELLLRIWNDVLDVDQNRFKSATCLAAVCAFWRQLAITAQELWSHVQDAPEHVVRCQLMRSRGAPLSLVYESGGPSAPGTVASSFFTACSQLERTRSIRFALRCEQAMAHMDDLLSSHSLPVLERLDLTGRSIRPLTTLRLNCDAPRLHFLSLRNIRPPADSPVFGASVRTMHIDYGRESGIAPLPLPDFLKMLRRMPLLEAMSFQGNLTGLDQDEQVESVQLPLLRDISITECVNTLANLFDKLNIPAVKNVNITLPREDRYLPHEIERLIATLEPTIRRIAASTPSRGAVVKADSRELALELYPLPLQLDGQCTQAPSFRLLSLLDFSPERQASHFVQSNGTHALLAMLNPDEVALRVSGPMSEFALTLWTYCPRAHTLTLVGPSHLHTPPSVLHSFASLPEESREMLLRNTHKIVLTGMAFDENRVIAVLNAFQGRVVRELHVVHSSGLCSNYISRWRELADDIVWDHVNADGSETSCARV